MENNIENYLIEEIQKLVQNKSMNDLFYNIESLETSIIIENIGNVDVSLREIRIYDLKEKDREWMCDSIGEFITPYIFSYSDKFDDYVLFENFPIYDIDEDSDQMCNDVGQTDLTFDELISYFKEIKNRIEEQKLLVNINKLLGEYSKINENDRIIEDNND